MSKITPVVAKSTPRKEFLQNEIKKITTEIESLTSTGTLEEDPGILTLKKELKFRQDDLKSL